MCGIAGLFSTDTLAADETLEDLRRMATAIAHRGPDDKGFWLEVQHGIAFCHRRLSIVDLSPLGHQPMTSANGRYTITFNGEIYNYRELRTELIAHGHTFRGSSDTEVLLAAVEQWDVETTLKKLVGMFAFGLWDRRERVLHLARDRFGEKPLHYSDCVDGQVLFASELKAIRAHRAFKGHIDRGALALFMRHGYIPTPHSIFSEVHKVRPGHLLTMRVTDGKMQVSERAYWQPGATAGHGTGAATEGREHVDRIESLLATAIGRQMVADVPVGAFLSGGIDSSLVVALMQKASMAPVHTFSIGLAEQEYNEAPFARAMAQHLGTRHTEIEVTPQDALAVVPRLPCIYDEPFADSSQIPTFLVSQLARADVTVSLSGDAGDELFGGYAIYPHARDKWQKLQRLPQAARFVAATLARHMPFGVSEQRKISALGWCVASFPQYYRSQTSLWEDPTRVVTGSSEPLTAAALEESWAASDDELTYMMYVDAQQYLPDDILVKVDRAAMAVSLETRVPLLDHAVAEAAWRIPISVHFNDGRGKWVLRQILERYVPRDMFDRPKKGFSVPLAAWLRNELRSWAEDLLEPRRLRSEGFFEVHLITRRWQQHLAGTSDWSAQIWTVLMFQSWLRASSGLRPPT